MVVEKQLEKKSSKSGKIKKAGVFICFLLPFIWVVYTDGPNIIFQFDQIEGEATIIRANSSFVKFEYYHAVENRVVNLSYKQSNIKKLEELKNQKKWKILYSKNFPERVSIQGIDSPPPGLGSFIYILIFAIPLIFFRKIEF